MRTLMTKIPGLSALLAEGISSRSYDSRAQCPSLGSVVVRPPPTFNISSPANEQWVPAPIGFQYGHWWVARSSNPTYFPIYNFQHDAYPVFPSGSYPGLLPNATINASNPPVVDLTSFNSNATNDTNVYTAFGYDWPRPGIPKGWVFDWEGTGTLSKTGNTWELLAWGFDTTGAEWTLIYETPVPRSNASVGAPAALDIECRNKNGPSNETYSTIMKGIKKLAIPELTALADQIRLLSTDHRRDGSPPIACDEVCVENA